MIDNRDNKKENAQEKSFPKVHVNCEKLIYINIPEITDNTRFLTSRFLHVFIN